MKKYLKQIVTGIIVVSLSLTGILLAPKSARASIAFDAATDGGLCSSCSSQTTSVTVTGTNPILICWFNTRGDSTTSETYNGVSMTKLDAGGSFFQISDWYVTGITGTHNVVANNSDPVAMVTQCGSWTGVDQANPIDNHHYTFNGAVPLSSTFTASVTVNTINSWVVGLMWDESSPNHCTINTGTERLLTTSGGNQRTVNDLNADQTTGSKNIIYNQDCTLADGVWDGYLVSLKPATAAVVAQVTQVTVQKGSLQVLKGQLKILGN